MLRTFGHLGEMAFGGCKSGVIALAAACLLCGATGASGVQMAASLDRSTIYLGTQATLMVQVVDPGSDEWPVVSAVDGLRITQDGSSSTIQDMFSGSIRRRYRFLISPERIGVFKIPSVTIGKGANAATQGPFTLRVQKAALKFLSAQIDPAQICTNGTATLTVAYQGVAADKDLVLPTIKGLSLGSVGSPEIEVMRSQGLPVSVYQVEVRGLQNGTYQIKGISLAGLPADAVKVQVTPFVVVDAQVQNSSLVVGSQTVVHVLMRGLSASDDVRLVVPGGLKTQRARQQYQGPPGTTVFSYDVTATDPGSPTITQIQLPSGQKVPLPRALALSVHEGGKGSILACRGKARGTETVVGEPFIVDYEVFFRGELQGIGIDTSQATFSNRPYIKVDPVENPSYKGWSGQALQARYSQKGQVTVLSGSGDLNGKKEQLLRFALKITPLAAGEVDLKGVRVIVRLVIRQERRSAGMFFSSTRSQDFSHTIDVPAHRVIDPPGQTAPAGYRGVVGTDLTYRTSLDRQTATAMSPLTLTMKISGEGVNAQLQPPALADIRDLTRDFDVSPTANGGDVQDNTITFSQVVRPRSESVTELPALPLVYYDYVKKRYETVYSLPIPITVTPGSVVGAAAMQTAAASAPSSVAQSTSQPAPKDVVALGANYATLGDIDSARRWGRLACLRCCWAGRLRWSASGGA